jgi:hypothetical protein
MTSEFQIEAGKTVIVDTGRADPAVLTGQWKIDNAQEGKLMVQVKWVWGWGP